MATRQPRVIPDDGDTIPSDSNGTPLHPLIANNENGVSSRVTERFGDDDDENIVDRVRAMLAQSPNDSARVRLYRVNNRSAKLDFCCVYLLPEFESLDLDGIREQWGAGDFEVRITDSTGVRGRSRVSIAAPYTGGRALAVPDQQRDETTPAITALLEGQAALLRALQDTRQPAPDPSAQLAQTVAMIASIKDVLMPSQPSTPAVDPMTMFTQVMTMIRESRSAIKEFTDDKPEKPDDDSPAGILGIARDVVEVVKLGMGNRAAPAPDTTPVQPITMPPSIAQAVPMTPQTDADTHPEQPAPSAAPTETMEQILMRGLIAELCEMAAAGKAVSHGADFIFDNLPDDLIPLMRNRLWFEAIAAAFPQIKPHETWMRAAKAEADVLFENEAAIDAADNAGKSPT